MPWFSAVQWHVGTVKGYELFEFFNVWKSVAGLFAEITGVIHFRDRLCVW